jgi:hypothetical protein
MALGEFFLVEVGNGHGHVLFLATGIGESEIDEFDVVFLDHLHNVGDSHFKLLNGMNNSTGGTTGRHKADSMPCPERGQSIVPQGIRPFLGKWMNHIGALRTLLVHFLAPI